VIYSCFDPGAGAYSYFEDDARIPVNADLPVPSLPPPAGTIGVPAIHAGRPLPAGARPAGQGLLAKGLLVDCGASGPLAGSFDAGTLPPAWKWVVALGLVAAVVWAAQTPTARRLVHGG